MARGGEARLVNGSAVYAKGHRHRRHTLCGSLVGVETKAMQRQRTLLWTSGGVAAGSEQGGQVQTGLRAHLATGALEEKRATAQRTSTTMQSRSGEGETHRKKASVGRGAVGLGSWQS